jgi:hypothetical protein
MVSVLVSVADSLPSKPLLHTQLELKARAGIGPKKAVFVCRGWRGSSVIRI